MGGSHWLEHSRRHFVRVYLSLSARSLSKECCVAKHAILGGAFDLRTVTWPTNLFTVADYSICYVCFVSRVSCRVSSVECRGASHSLSLFILDDYTDVDRGSHSARLAQSRRDICIPNITESDNLSPVGHPDIKDRGTHTLLSLSPMLFRNRLAANVSRIMLLLHTKIERTARWTGKQA